MAKFKVGDRAKINIPGNEFHGKQCTIVAELTHALISDSAFAEPKLAYVYPVDIDGVGSLDTKTPCPNCGQCHGNFAYEPDELIPLQPPRADFRETEWYKNLMNVAPNLLGTLDKVN